MASFTDRLINRTANDLRHCNRMLGMYEERNRVYRADRNRAYMRGDDGRMDEISADLTAFRLEMDALEAKQRSAAARIATLRGGGGFPRTIGT